MRSKIQFIQFLSNSATMAAMILIPLLAKQLGASNFVVGISVTVYFFTFFLSSFASGILADKFGHLRFIRWGLVFAALAFGLQIFIDNIYTLILIRALAGWAVGTFPSALAAYAYKERGGRMGRFAAYGSLGWSLGAIFTGIVSAYNPVFLAGAVFLLFAFVFSFGLGEGLKPLKYKIAPFRLMREDWRIYLAYFLRNTGAHMIWMVLPLFLLSLGANRLWIGIMYFFMTFPQFIFMQYVEKFDNRKLIALGVSLAIIIFLGYAFSPNWIFILPLQILTALSFSCLYVGTFQELLRRHEEKATVAGVLNGVWNLAAVAGPFLGGVASQFYGYRGNMFFAAALAALAFFILLNGKRFSLLDVIMSLKRRV